MGSFKEFDYNFESLRCQSKGCYWLRTRRLSGLPFRWKGPRCVDASFKKYGLKMLGTQLISSKYIWLGISLGDAQTTTGTASSCLGFSRTRRSFRASWIAPTSSTPTRVCEAAMCGPKHRASRSTSWAASSMIVHCSSPAQYCLFCQHPCQAQR